MKLCKVCLENKENEEFYRDKSRKDGLARECKNCCNKRKSKFVEENRLHVNEVNRINAQKHKVTKSEYNKKRYEKIRDSQLGNQRKYYAQNKERIRKNQNEKNRTPERKEKNRQRQIKWIKENAMLARSYYKKWRELNPEKCRAHSSLNSRVKRGKIIKPKNCERCLIKCRPEGHHEDYSKLYDVIWLCKSCHVKETFK